jgi:hypothetical protein
MYVCNFQNGLDYESWLTHIYSFSFSRSEHQAYVKFFIVLDDKLLLWSLICTWSFTSSKQYDIVIVDIIFHLSSRSNFHSLVITL